WLVDVLVNTVLANMFVATAGGQMLRLLAWAVNVTAKPASAAEGVLRFYKESSGADVTIPAGTQIQTERINGVIYTLSVTADFTIEAGTASGLVPVKAEQAGAAYNLAPGYYRILPVAVSGISHAVSEEDWLTAPGADEESDDELRERCRNQFNLVGNYHTDAVYRSMIAGVVGLSIDRIFFEHDAPRGPGTANAYLLLDSGVASAPFIAAVNDYVNTQGHHGHGDDMQCFGMPETLHNLSVTLFVKDPDNISAENLAALRGGVENLIRCAFRENTDYDVRKTWPYGRYSFSNLGREIHRTFPEVDSVNFTLGDIVSDLNVPRLKSLTVSIEHD
ncbi:baseplate J/gp47 family protein, partial [Pantoea sp. CTOTU50773]|uniref:baseplate J/gp47 family protein n=1 Tax=Pantoea sp. CTOTU50773 TaxID=2953853 RepID=UPI0028A89073